MLTSQKHLFSLQEDLHYLNCAYKAPLLKASEAACIEALMMQRTPTSITPATFFEPTAHVRQLFAQLVNCEAAEVAIIPATSYGLASVLQNIACKTGQYAVTVENEFPSDYFALKRWSTDNNTTIQTIRPDDTLELKGAAWNEQILAAITNDVAVIVLSSVHWMNGIVFDLEKIGAKCQETGTKLIVDGTQSVGAKPIDVKKCHIDALICAGYKWLMGPYSLSLAYIGEAFHAGRPLEETWMNRSNAAEFGNLTTYEENYTPKAGRYNVGETSNFTLMPYMAASLTQLNAWGIENIQAFCANLIQPLLQYLKANTVQLEPESYFSPHLFGLKLPASVNTEVLKSNLAKNNISISFRGTSLRISVNVFNTEADIQALINTIEMSKL